MAAFPELNIGRQLSPDPYTPVPGRENAAALAAIAETADHFGARLQDMADRATVVEGKAAAIADVDANRVTSQNEATIFGDAYARVAKDALGIRRKAAMTEQMNRALIDYGDSPDKLETALSDIRRGFAASPTPFADLNQDLDGAFVLQRADIVTRAAAAAKSRTIEQGKANFLITLQHGAQQLDQVASGATFDDAGGTRVVEAWRQLVTDLAKYGPKEAFVVNGLQFAADDSRAGALGADDIARQASAAQAGARVSWILSQADRLHTGDERRLFLSQLRDSWQKGDPMLEGLPGDTAQRLFDHIDAQADHADTDDRQAQARHGQNARDQIEALQWGGDYDRTIMLAEAHASGDAGLIAQAAFFAEADDKVRGVLKTVVARQLGILPDPSAGPGPVWVDPTGHPVAGGGGGRAPIGVRNNNPGNLRPLAQGRMWQGQTGESGGFAVFATPQAGMAAAEQNLIGYQTRHGLTTLNGMIARWAPKDDGNDPVAYAARVGAAVGVDPAAPIDIVKDGGLRKRILSQMFQVELGGSWGVAPGGTSWTPPADAPRGSPAYAAWASTQEGFSSDPLEFARGGKSRGPLATVPVLVPDGVLAQDPAQVGAWTAALRQRQALGASLGRTYGVPSRLLTNGEREYYKSLIAQDPTMAVKLAQASSAAIGGDGAVAFMRELGQGQAATVDAHLGVLAAHGSVSFASRAAEGIAFKADGQKLERGDLDHLDNEMERRRAAFARVPQVLIAARGAAEAAMIADQAKGVRHDAGYYLDSALGATNAGGKLYGGVAKFNGAATPLPMWLGQDRLDEAFAAFAKSWEATDTGPVYSNGKEIPAGDLIRMRLVAQANGHYRVVNGAGGTVMARSGHPFEVDFEAGKGFLKRNLPPGSIR